ncbi:MAG: serine hydrolase [Calditrichaeota bacterium]|nr:MAG: serine hydrolase [Calditrichota bacterium]MBL1207408.1 serine hydrolase [Calditrichota bacterium]
MILLFLIFNVGLAQDTVLVKLNDYVKNLMEKTNTPGLAMAVVKDDETVYSKGFGKLEFDSNREVNENTLFAIGSISKSFTAACLAMLVEEEKINWDDKVQDHLSDFQLYDPWVTREFTIRDLLLHHTGYPYASWGSLYYGSELSRGEIFKRLKFLKPSTSFRSKLAYQNVTYMIAGLIIEKVTGKSFENFVRENLFTPLGMDNSFAQFQHTKTKKNLSSPHIFKQNKIQKVNNRNYEGIGPAGALYSTAKDMATYIKFIIDQGVFNGDTLIAPRVFSELLKPHVSFPFWGYSEFEHYGFGWFISNQGGYKVIEHGGGVDGFSADIVIVPELNLGVVVLTNQELLASSAISRFVIGQYIGVNNYDISPKILEWNKKYIEREKKRVDNLGKNQIKHTQPSVALETFTGTYNDKMYGELYIGLENDKLRLSFEHSPTFNAVLEHYHYNIFRLLWQDPTLPDGLIVFNLNSKNKINGFDFDIPGLLDADFKELQIKKKK